MSLADSKWAFLAMLVLIVVACGGSEGTSDTEVKSADDRAVPAEAEHADPDVADANTASADDDEVGGEGINAALVTIEGEGFEFDVTEGPIAQCKPDMFGIFFVVGQTADGSTLTMSLPREGEEGGAEPPNVSVKDIVNDRDLIADQALIEKPNFSEVMGDGQSQVDDYVVEGNSVSGTATFVDEQQIFAALGGTGDPPEPLVGSFAVQCDG